MEQILEKAIHQNEERERKIANGEPLYSTNAASSRGGKFQHNRSYQRDNTSDAGRNVIPPAKDADAGHRANRGRGNSAFRGQQRGLNRGNFSSRGRTQGNANTSSAPKASQN